MPATWAAPKPSGPGGRAAASGIASAERVTGLERQHAAEADAEARFVDRRLRVEPALEQVHEHLHLRLRLHEPAGHAEHDTAARRRG